MLDLVLEIRGKTEDEDEHDDENDAPASPDFNHTRGACSICEACASEMSFAAHRWRLVPPSA